MLLFSTLDCASSIERLRGSVNVCLIKIINKNYNNLKKDNNEYITKSEGVSVSSQLIIKHANSIAVFLKSGILLVLAIGNKALMMLLIKNSLKGENN